MAPPAPAVPAPPTARLPVNVLSVTVRVAADRRPKLAMAPPDPLLLRGLPTLPPRAWLPVKVSWLAPGPLIVRSSVMLNSPLALVRVMVPFNPPANLMTSAPGVVLAAVIAARSEPEPLSARLVTVKVLGTVRSSSTSRRGRKERGRGSVRREERGCGPRRPRTEPPLRHWSHEGNSMVVISCEEAVWDRGAGRPQ